MTMPSGSPPTSIAVFHAAGNRDIVVLPSQFVLILYPNLNFSNGGLHSLVIFVHHDVTDMDAFSIEIKISGPGGQRSSARNLPFSARITP